eukprot:361994-Chlamydomonas_euryale.AAC.4
MERDGAHCSAGLRRGVKLVLMHMYASGTRTMDKPCACSALRFVQSALGLVAISSSRAFNHNQVKRPFTIPDRDMSFILLTCTPELHSSRSSASMAVLAHGGSYLRNQLSTVQLAHGGSYLRNQLSTVRAPAPRPRNKNKAGHVRVGGTPGHFFVGTRAYVRVQGSYMYEAYKT